MHAKHYTEESRSEASTFSVAAPGRLQSQHLLPAAETEVILGFHGLVILKRIRRSCNFRRESCLKSCSIAINLRCLSRIRGSNPLGNANFITAVTQCASCKRQAERTPASGHIDYMAYVSSFYVTSILENFPTAGVEWARRCVPMNRVSPISLRSACTPSRGHLLFPRADHLSDIFSTWK